MSPHLPAASTPARAALYVPATRPELFGKASRSGADFIIIDLEDSVPQGQKDAARAAAVKYLSTVPPLPTEVRINARQTPWYAEDLEALATVRDALVRIRLPKTEQVDDADRVAHAVGGTPVHALIETALGVENMFDIAHSDAVASIGLGEADLRSQLSIIAPNGLDWIRSRLVVAARAAALPQPMMSVWTSIEDLEGLASSCRTGRDQGFLGRTAIHPAQVPVILESFRPSPGEVNRARQVLAALGSASVGTKGVAVLDDGSMVDEAMRSAAEHVIRLSQVSRDIGS